MRKSFFIALSLLVAAAASAAQFRDFYVIPAAAHATGANGTSWRTDVSILNVQQEPVTIDFAVVESGEGLLDNIVPVAVGTSGASSITVPAGGSMTLTDVLNNHRGRSETTGALLLGGNMPFAVTSRTYDATPNGTFGQTVAPSSDLLADADGTSKLFIPGIVSNASFRTNFGLLMAAATPLTVTVTLTGTDGRSLGTRTFNVGPGVTTHVQFGASSVAIAPFDTAGAIVQITAGSGSVVGYASVVDNVTGDASFIPAGGLASAGAPSLQSLLAAAQER